MNTTPEPTTVPFTWDSPTWGQPGHNIHHGTTDDLGDHGRHTETGDDQ